LPEDLRGDKDNARYSSDDLKGDDSDGG